ncbi:MAG: ankyrin repeat domain-containing protein [Brevinema sp.]
MVKLLITIILLCNQLFAQEVAEINDTYNTELTEVNNTENLDTVADGVENTGDIADETEVPVADDGYYYEQYFYEEVSVTNTIHQTNVVTISNSIYITNHAYTVIPSIETISPNICMAVLKSDSEDIKKFLEQNPSLIYSVRGDGNSLLHIAATRPNGGIALYLIQKGADINRLNQAGRTPLHIAAQHNNISVANILIQQKASLRIYDKFGQTPLWIANIKGFPTMLQILAKAQNTQEPLSPSIQQKKRQVAGLNPPNLFDLHENFVYKLSKSGPITNTPWHKALFNIGFQETKKLIELGMNQNYPDRKGQTALHIAALYDNTLALEYLLSLSLTDLNVGDNFGNTPLHIAAEKASSNTVKLLINNGYNVHQTNKSGWTPLFQAVLFKNSDVVRYLLQQGISPNTKTSKGRTPLHEAARLGFNFIVRDLLDVGADYKSLDSQGNSPLLLAAENGHIDSVVQLHQKGDDGTAINYRQQTPLHVAILNNHINIVRYLIDQMNLDIGIIDDLGRSVLDIAYLKGNNEIISYLTTKYIEQQTTISSTLITGTNLIADTAEENIEENIDTTAQDIDPNNIEEEEYEEAIDDEYATLYAEEEL